MNDVPPTGLQFNKPVPRNTPQASKPAANAGAPQPEPAPQQQQQAAKSGALESWKRRQEEEKQKKLEQQKREEEAKKKKLESLKTKPSAGVVNPDEKLVRTVKSTDADEGIDASSLPSWSSNNTPSISDAVSPSMAALLKNPPKPETKPDDAAAEGVDSTPLPKFGKSASGNTTSGLNAFVEPEPVKKKPSVTMMLFEKSGQAPAKAEPAPAPKTQDADGGRDRSASWASSSNTNQSFSDIYKDMMRAAALEVEQDQKRNDDAPAVVPATKVPSTEGQTASAIAPTPASQQQEQQEQQEEETKPPAPAAAEEPPVEPAQPAVAEPSVVVVAQEEQPASSSSESAIAEAGEAESNPVEAEVIVVEQSAPE